MIFNSILFWNDMPAPSATAKPTPTAAQQ